MSTENTNNMFIKASREKMRFESGRGSVSVEDLWDFNLSALDNIAVSLDEKIQKAGRKSFVDKRTPSTSAAVTQLEIVKFVIETKQAEDEARKTRAEKAGQKDFLKSLLEKKRMEQLEGLSAEEIQKQIDSLG